MVSEVAAMIAPFAREHGADGLRGVHMLGTSGTVTTIAGVHLNLKRYDRNRVDGCWMSEQEINVVLEKLLAMSYEDRVASPCIGAERADLVLAGCAILEAIRRAFPCPRLRVADRGLREGMLVQMMRDDGAWGDATWRRQSDGGVVTGRGKERQRQRRARFGGSGQDRQGPQAVIQAVAGAPAQRSIRRARQARRIALARRLSSCRKSTTRRASSKKARA